MSKEINKTVTIKSTVNAQVYVTIPYLNLRRHWPQKGAIVRLPLETMEEAVYDPGFEHMLRSGSLYIEDMAQKIHLGLEDPEAEVPTSIVVLSEKEQEELLEKPNKEFTEMYNTLSLTQQTELANFAATSKAPINRIKNDLFKKTVGIDVMEVVDLHTEDDSEGASR